MASEITMIHSSNQSSLPDGLGEFKSCYKRDQGQVFWLVLAVIFLSYIAYLLTSSGRSESVFVWGLAAVVVVRAIWVMSDNKVKLCFNEEGLFAKGRWIKTGEIEAYQVIERREGVRLQYFLDLSLRDGSRQRIELSGLNKPVKDVLQDLSQQFEAPPTEDL
jgi:hypothetical protein